MTYSEVEHRERSESLTGYQVLKQARELLAQPSKWIGGREAADKLIKDGVDIGGTSCLANARTAWRWTPYGAIRKVCNCSIFEGDWPSAYGWLQFNAQKLGFPDMYSYNTASGRTLQDVLRLFDATMEWVLEHHIGTDEDADN